MRRNISVIFIFAIAFLLPTTVCRADHDASAGYGERLARAAFCDEAYFCEEIAAESSLVLSLDAAEYEKYIEKATVFRSAFSSEGRELWYIRTAADAREAAALLHRAYERVPCEPSETAMLLAAEGSVVFIKGGGETAEAVKREMEALFGKFTEYVIW